MTRSKNAAGRLRASDRAPDCATCESRALGIFCVLDPAAAEELDRHRRSRFYEAGQVLYYEGDPAHALSCVRSGRVKLSNFDSDGKSLILGVAGPGDVLGVESVFSRPGHDIYASRAEMVEDGIVCSVDRDFVHALVRRDPCFAIRVIESLSRDLREANESRVDLAYRSVRERVARLLILLAHSHGEELEGGTRIALHLSREEIASMAGTATETSIRVLGDFARKGLIELESDRAHSIVVRDEAALVRIAHEPVSMSGDARLL